MKPAPKRTYSTWVTYRLDLLIQVAVPDSIATLTPTTTQGDEALPQAGRVDRRDGVGAGTASVGRSRWAPASPRSMRTKSPVPHDSMRGRAWITSARCTSAALHSPRVDTSADGKGFRHVCSVEHTLLGANSRAKRPTEVMMMLKQACMIRQLPLRQFQGGGLA